MNILTCTKTTLTPGSDFGSQVALHRTNLEEEKYVKLLFDFYGKRKSKLDQSILTEEENLAL